MKRNFKNVLLLLLCFITIFTFVGCGGGKNLSPQEVIENEYGDTQFKISFDSSSLEEPLRDVFYSAKNMPILPTPKKVGFVFAGWYFNSSLTEPCNVSDGDLYWKMKDLTLYPKWEEEKIVNNGTYEIEYNAEIVGKVTEGPKADGYQKFPEDIIKSETYIEKNDKGIFLRIQYDNVVRGPVLGSSGSDENNFSKMTYTVTEDDGRINKDISIQDRTNTIQTIYYNLENLKLTDPINLHIEYYNWKINIPDEKRKLATVRYDVEFKISRFIGFEQAFVNPEGKLEDGIYVVPTHYTKLDKTFAMLDMFNPVYSYIQASNGHYTLYKPLNTYNNDSPNIKPKDFPLRTSGYARDFACMYIDKNKTISNDIEEDVTSAYYLPELIGATEYIPLTYEFHADTGRYYYVIDLGETLDNDLAMIGGSSGAMESMVSLAFDYHRIVIDYNSMVKIVDWDYKPLSGNEYRLKDKVAFYPGNIEDFAGTNKEFDIIKQYRQAIYMTNVFFTVNFDEDGQMCTDKLFDTKLTISPDRYYDNPSRNRYKYQLFNMSYSAYGYNPFEYGDLYARDLTFINNNAYRRTNSFVNRRLNGKTYNIGDAVDIDTLYNEKVASNVPSKLKYKAYKVDDKLNIDTSHEINIGRKFAFNENIAIMFDSIRNDNTHESSLVYLMKKDSPELRFIGENWEKDSNGIYKTTERFDIGAPVDIPEILYTYYGVTDTTHGLKKYHDVLVKYSDLNTKDDFEQYERARVDFTKISAWKYYNGVYTPIDITLMEKHSFIMNSERVRVLIQLVNPFNEFVPLLLEFNGVNAGVYEIKLNGNMIASSDITYKGTVREKIKYQMQTSYHIEKEIDVNNIPNAFDMTIINDGITENSSMTFKNAIIYLKNNTIKVNSISDIWNHINGENYAVINMMYANDYGDTVEYKAEYNFRLNNKIADEYYALNKGITVFDGESYRITNPIISGYDYTIMGNGNAKLYKKYGEKYELAKIEDGSAFSGTYDTSIKFITSGSYLLCWNFLLIHDENGDMVFDAVVQGAEYTYVTFNICQEIEVLDRNSEAKLTYATDKDHPFNEAMKQELIASGYEFSEDAEYQYMTVLINSNVISFTLEENVLDTSDYYLFGWGTKDGKLLYKPDNQVQNIVTVQKTLEPILYAVWDVPIEVDLTYDFGGKLYKPFDKKIKIYRKSQNLVYDMSGESDFYINSFFDNLPNELKKYALYGWKADKPVIEDYISVNNSNYRIYTDNVKGGYSTKMQSTESFSLTAVFKKTTYVGYEAYDEAGNKLKFSEEVKNDHNLFIPDLFKEVISFEKMEQLNDLYVTDIKLSFKHWEVYDKELKKFVEVHLDTFILEDKYSDVNGKITLRAVFG